IRRPQNIARELERQQYQIWEGDDPDEYQEVFPIEKEGTIQQFPKAEGAEFSVHGHSKGVQMAYDATTGIGQGPPSKLGRLIERIRPAQSGKRGGRNSKNEASRAHVRAAKYIR